MKYKIEIYDNETYEVLGYLTGPYTADEAERICEDMEYVFLDVYGTPWDMRVVEDADEDRAY